MKIISGLIAAAFVLSPMAASAQAPNGGPSASQNSGTQSSGGAQGGRMDAPGSTSAIGTMPRTATPNGGPSASQRSGAESTGGAQGSGPAPARQ